MQLRNVVVALFAGIAAADTDPITIVAQVPACAMTCLLRGASTVGCDPTDYKCQCSHMAELNTAVAPCLAAGCSVTDISKATVLSAELCGSLGFASVSQALISMTATMTAGASATTTTKSNGTVAVTTSSPTATRNAAARPEWVGMGIAGAGAALLAGLVL